MQDLRFPGEGCMLVIAVAWEINGKEHELLRLRSVGFC
jgi:hypothetical protein